MYLMIKHTNLLPVAKKFKNITSTDERVLIHLKDVFLKLKSIIELNSSSYQWYKCLHPKGLSKCGEKCNSVRGGIFAPCTSIINHSCVANLNRFTLPEPKIIVYTSMPIKKGEQLSLSYGPSFHSSIAERKVYLEEMYYTCRCLACMDDQSFKIENINVEKCRFKLLKVKSKFEKIYGKNAVITFYPESDPLKLTVFSEAALKQAYKLIELYFKYLQYNEACNFTSRYQYYIRRAFHELYGEKCAMLDHC